MDFESSLRRDGEGGRSKQRPYVRVANPSLQNRVASHVDRLT